MFKNSRLKSLKQTAKNESEKQKQKKILSFKEPEIEKSPIEERLRAEHTPRKTTSLENLTLDDAALSIARSVGIAFEKPTDPHRASSRSSSRSNELQLQTNKSNQRTDQQQTRKMKDFECLEALPPTGPTTMGCPAIKLTDDASEANEQDAWRHDQDFQNLPTIASHQIQLLNYHLEQQRQRTQTAMYQIQLLKDQLEAESAARYQAQVHNQKLMMQNKDLLDHIQKLFQQVQDLEQKIANLERLENDNVVQRESKKSMPAENLGVPQLSQRRGSGTNSQLWSASCSTLGPTYNQVRRTSATSLQLEQEANKIKQKDSLLKPNPKDEPQSRFPGLYDTDWRCRRRGSNNFSLTNDRTNDQDEKPETMLGESLSKNRVLSTSIPELKSSASSSSGRSTDDSHLRMGEKITGTTHLQIGTPSATWSRWSDIKAKAMETQSASYLASADKLNSLPRRNEDFQKSNSKLRNSLKLFN